MSHLDERQLDEDGVRDRLVRLPEEPLLEHQLGLDHLPTFWLLFGRPEFGNDVTDVLVLVQANVLVCKEMPQCYFQCVGTLGIGPKSLKPSVKLYFHHARQRKCHSLCRMLQAAFRRP